MPRLCAVTGKKAQSGNNVSHANNRTRRRFEPNLQACSFPSEILGRMVSLRLTAHGVRTIEHRGGLDAWLMSAKARELTPPARALQKRLQKAKARKKA